MSACPGVPLLTHPHVRMMWSVSVAPCLSGIHNLVHAIGSPCYLVQKEPSLV